MHLNFSLWYQSSAGFTRPQNARRQEEPASGLGRASISHWRHHKTCITVFFLHLRRSGNVFGPVLPTCAFSQLAEDQMESWKQSACWAVECSISIILGPSHICLMLKRVQMRTSLSYCFLRENQLLVFLAMTETSQISIKAAAHLSDSHWIRGITQFQWQLFHHFWCLGLGRQGSVFPFVNFLIWAGHHETPLMLALGLLWRGHKVGWLSMDVLLSSRLFISCTMMMLEL